MEIENPFELVYNYYKRIFFLFVPNLCNAKCSFCYVEPGFSKKAIFSNSILQKTDEFVKIAKEVGFNEFRITGGEPLLFENLIDLISVFQSNKVSYTLLTNGLNIQKYFDFFENNKPQKITISYHSKNHHQNIFGIDFNTDLLDENLKELCRRNIPLTVSVLFLECNSDEIYSHVLHLVNLGVNSFKFIYPNDPQIKMNFIKGFKKTLMILNTIKGIEVRYSDTINKNCSLLNRGFLSYKISQSKIFACCNFITDKNFISNFYSKENLTSILLEFYNASREIKLFPCKSYVDFCPIVLNN